MLHKPHCTPSTAQYSTCTRILNTFTAELLQLSGLLYEKLDFPGLAVSHVLAGRDTVVEQNTLWQCVVCSVQCAMCSGRGAVCSE